MLEFISHASFEKETAKLQKRFTNLLEDIERLKRLCEKQFHPTDPQQIIAPAKLHRVTQNTLWVVWKVEMVVTNSGLRPNQFPRVWFAVQGSKLAFLCIKCHPDNYGDNEVNAIAFERVRDIF